MKLRNGLGILAASAALFGGPADAVTLTSGQSTTLLWSATVDGANLNATALFTLSSLNGTTAVFAVSVANNTLSGQPGQNRLVSFGVKDITPNLTNAVITNNGTGDTWGATRNTNFPGFQTVELCIWAGNNCSGGGNNGLIEGESDAFTLTLTGNFAGSISFSAPFPSKWQSVGNHGGSTEFAGCVQGTQGCGQPACQPGTPSCGTVPEPGTLALLGLGLLGLGAARRRRV